VNLTAGEQLRDYISVTDSAEAFWRALDRDTTRVAFMALNVGSGRQIQLREFVALIAAEMSRRGYNPDLRFGELPYRDDEQMFYAPDVALCRRELNWLPSDDIPRLISEAVNEFCEGEQL